MLPKGFHPFDMKAGGKLSYRIFLFMIRVERHPSRKQLTVFGLLWLAFFGFWGTASWLQAGIDCKAAVFWTLALTVPAAGLFRQEILRVVFLLSAYLTLPVGLTVSSVILLVIYYLVLTPIGIVARLAGHDPMHRKFDPDAATYWVPRHPVADRERYFKQF